LYQKPKALECNHEPLWLEVVDGKLILTEYAETKSVVFFRPF
jgi:hypothetical protein